MNTILSLQDQPLTTDNHEGDKHPQHLSFSTISWVFC